MKSLKMYKFEPLWVIQKYNFELKKLIVELIKKVEQRIYILNRKIKNSRKKYCIEVWMGVWI